MAVAGFGDPTPAHRGAAGVLRGYQPQIGHEFLGVVEPVQGSHFRHHGGRNDEGHPTQGLVGGDEGGLTPLGDQVPDLPGETQHPGAGLPYRVQVFLEDDLLGRVVHDLLQEPGPMAPAPGGFARINAAVTQQKGHGALPGPALHADGVLSGPGQVPHGFVVGVGHLNRGEFSGPQQPGQGQGIPAVVFQTVAGAPGDQGGGGHQAAMALGRQMPVDLVAARSGLISEAQFGALGLEFRVTLSRASKSPPIRP